MGKVLDLLRATQGNAAMLFALVTAPLLLAGGMAVDFARTAQARSVVQEAADAALLRVARLRTQDPSLSDADLTMAARKIFDSGVKSLEDVIIDSFGVVYDDANETFTLNVAGDMGTELLAAAGVKKLRIDTVSGVKLGAPSYLEVVMALDNTGSMNENSKIASLRSSASSLVDSLFTIDGAEIKVGLVPFAQYVNVGTANAGETWLAPAPAGWTGCVGSRNFPANTEDSNYELNRVPPVVADCPDAITPLTDDKAAILSAIGSMNANGWTYIAEGLAWGWRVLSDEAPFVGGLSYSDIRRRGGSKVLIVLTDGKNTKAPSYPEHESADTSLADGLTARLCEDVKKKGIVVYTIAFDVSDAGVRGLLEDCGTTPGHYYAPDNASELGDAFAEIATSLRGLSLSK
jgi:Flp pilus assembly protein TadG